MHGIFYKTMSATTTTRQGDTWDILSKRLYGNEHYMEKLIEANLEHRKTVLFSYGTVINGPEIDIATDETSVNLPPWKRQ